MVGIPVAGLPWDKPSGINCRALVAAHRELSGEKA